jgi:MFS family permease
MRSIVVPHGSPPEAIDRAAPSLTIPPLIKRNTLFLAIAQACVGIGNQMVPTLGALMVVQLLGSPTLAGLATSIMGGCRFIVAYPIGLVTDRYGRRVGLLLGLLASLAGALITGWALLLASLAVFLGGLVLFGVGVGAVQQLRLAAADMYPPSRRATGLGYVLTGSLIGAMGGPVLISIAQLLAPRLALDPLALPWLLVPFVLLPSLGLVLLVRPDPKEIAANLERYYPGYRAPRPASRSLLREGSPAAFLRHYPKLATFVASFAVQGNMTMMMAMNALALAHHGHGLPAISLSVAIHIIGMFGFSLPIGRLTDAFGRRTTMLAGLVAAGVGGVLVPTATEYWLVTIGTFLVGLGWSGVNVAAVALLSDTTRPQERGRVIGTNDTFSGAAAIALPFLAGPLVALAGLPSLAVVSLALMGVPLGLLLRLREPGGGKYAEGAR